MLQVPDIAPFRKRQAELDTQMAAPDFYGDARRAAEVSREHQKLGALIELYERFAKVENDLSENRALAEDASAEDELKELASAEIPGLEEERERLAQEVLVAMIPPEASDSRNIIVEVRGGAGGDEAALFAGDLWRMYTRFAEGRGWRTEVLSVNETEGGGVKEVIFSLAGEEAYKALKFESGVHRVQRIPVTESGGRIHTSTATVAVLPEAEEVDVEIKQEELEITVTRASGPGGQGVNTTDSAVQILHKPTGLIVFCADERSQLKNKQKALRVLRSRLLQQKEEEERQKYAEHRKSQVGTGDRSERIRTYNFPQSRVTDHRIGLTLHSLAEVMEGALDPLIDALQEADQKAKLDELLDRQEASAEEAQA